MVKWSRTLHEIQETVNSGHQFVKIVYIQRFTYSYIQIYPSMV